MDGCDFNSLEIQPAQFFLPEECPLVVRQKHGLLIKPANGLHGHGIQYFEKPPSLIECQMHVQSIAQIYVANPALVDKGKKFDLRTWLLIARLDPLLVFHSDGFARVASQTFDISLNDPMVHITNAEGQEEFQNHFQSFGDIELDLIRAYPATFAKGYFSSSFRLQVDKASKIAALAQFKTLHGQFSRKPRLGIFHLFAGDWIVDERGNVH